MAPSCPQWVQGKARELWESKAPGMVAAGLLAPEDLNAFERYCRTYALWSRMAEQLDSADHIGESAARALTRLDNQLRRLESAFGLTPADRAKLKLPERPPSEDPFAKPPLRLA